MFTMRQNNKKRSTFSNGCRVTPELISGPLAMKIACIFSSLLSYPCTPNFVFGPTIEKIVEKLQGYCLLISYGRSLHVVIKFIGAIAEMALHRNTTRFLNVPIARLSMWSTDSYWYDGLIFDIYSQLISSHISGRNWSILDFELRFLFLFTFQLIKHENRIFTYIRTPDEDFEYISHHHSQPLSITLTLKIKSGKFKVKRN